MTSDPSGSLLQAIRDAGQPVTSLSDLVNSDHPYPAAVPVVVQWLDNLSPKEVRRYPADVEMAIRSLAVQEAQGTEAASVLIRLMRRLPRQSNTLLWTIGNTLEVLANESIEEDLFAIATDRAFGMSRQMVVLGLQKLRTSTSERVLIELLSDSQVAGHAAIALGRRRSAAAIPELQRLAREGKPWVRKEAMKALSAVTG